MATQIAPQNSNFAETLFRTSSKLALSGAYLAGGLTLIAGGVCSSVYTYQKSIQFYTTPLPEPDQDSFLNKIPGFGKSVDQSIQGFKACSSITDWLQLTSGPSICTDLSTKSWKEISSPESIVAAIGATILGNGAVFVLSSYAIMAGASLIGKSFNAFTEALSSL